MRLKLGGVFLNRVSSSTIYENHRMEKYLGTELLII